MYFMRTPVPSDRVGQTCLALSTMTTFTYGQQKHYQLYSFACQHYFLTLLQYQEYPVYLVAKNIWSSVADLLLITDAWWRAIFSWRLKATACMQLDMVYMYFSQCKGKLPFNFQSLRNLLRCILDSNIATS